MVEGAKHIARVYYWKDIKWNTNLSFAKGDEVKKMLPTVDQFLDEWVKVAEYAITTTNPEEVWMGMNLNVDDHFDRSAYKKMITPHTSMSIGDIVEIDGQLYMAVSVGFVELPISAEVHDVDL